MCETWYPQEVPLAGALRGGGAMSGLLNRYVMTERGYQDGYHTHHSSYAVSGPAARTDPVVSTVGRGIGGSEYARVIWEGACCRTTPLC